MKKCMYIPTNRTFEDDFNYENATVIAANIKACKTKEIVKPMIPDKTVTSWAVFITFKITSTGEVADGIWKLDKTVTSEHNDVPCIAVMKKKKKIKGGNKIKESAIPSILRAIGVDEWDDIVGTTVRIKSICGTHMTRNGFCISPINESSGRWFYPHYFEFQDPVESKPMLAESDVMLSKLKMLTDIPADHSDANNILDRTKRNLILTELIKQNKDFDGDILEYDGISYFVDGMKGIIKIVEHAESNDETNEISGDTCKPTPVEKLIHFIKEWMAVGSNYIAQADQNQFKQRFTKLYDEAFGREEDNGGRDYGFAKMNKLLEKQNIGYKIKVVYATEEMPRHWVIVDHDWNK